MLKNRHRQAFTLLEVLISIGLMGIIMTALFSAVSMMRDSNSHLLKYLEKSKQITKATEVLYLDILSSDGHLTIKKEEFTNICMEETRNSLYGLPQSKVCWVVLKEKNTLARVEGNGYKLPLSSSNKVEVDKVMAGIEIFDIYHQKDKVLVFLKQNNKEPIMFMVQGVRKPIPAPPPGTNPSGVNANPAGNNLNNGGAVAPTGVI